MTTTSQTRHKVDPRQRPAPVEIPVQIARARTWSAVGDLAMVGALIAIGLVGFRPAFGNFDYLLAGLGGTVLGLALAWLGARRRLGLLPMAALTIVVYALAGAALVYSAEAIAGVVPTGRILRDLAVGAITCWQELVTASVPLAAFGQLAVAPYLLGLVASVIGASIALRSRRHFGWAFLPPALVAIAVIALGTDQAAWPLVQGISFAAICLCYAAWRVGQRRALSRQLSSAGPPAEAGKLRARRIRNAALTLLVAGVVAALATPVPAARTVIRDQVEPPLDLQDYPSPLVGFRKFVKDHPDDVLFTVKGMGAANRLALATLDGYDGAVYNVASGSGSGSFDRSGAIANAGDAASSTVTVTVGAYGGVWVPQVGSVQQIQFLGSRRQELADRLYLNKVTNTAITTAGLRTGDSYQITTRITKPYTADQLQGRAFQLVEQPPVERVPDSVASTATELIGDVDMPVKQVENLNSGLQAGGFSHGLADEVASLPGHSADRINSLLTGPQMIGDDEQYAVAMALMARQRGIPARVVMGFHRDFDSAEPATGSEYQVRGKDVHAWVEVNFAGAGWVAFDPTPPEDQKPQSQAPKSKDKPKPQVLQPPPPPEEPQDTPPESIPDPEPEKGDPDKNTSVPVGLMRAIQVAVPVLLLTLPLVIVASLKGRRRRRRRANTGPPGYSGGWREVVDRATDLGQDVPATATRRELAGALATTFDAPATVAVAERADAGIFSDAEPTQEDLAAFWAEVDQSLSGMSRSVGRWRRIRARFSLRSLLHGRRRRR